MTLITSAEISCPVIVGVLSHHVHSSYSHSVLVAFNSSQPHGLKPTRLLCPWYSPGKNTGVGCHFLLQGIFLTQGSNPGLLHCRQVLYHWAPREAPNIHCQRRGHIKAWISEDHLEFHLLHPWSHLEKESHDENWGAKKTPVIQRHKKADRKCYLSASEMEM